MMKESDLGRRGRRNHEVNYRLTGVPLQVLPHSHASSVTLPGKADRVSKPICASHPSSPAPSRLKATLEIYMTYSGLVFHSAPHLAALGYSRTGRRVHSPQARVLLLGSDLPNNLSCPEYRLRPRDQLQTATITACC